MIASTVSMGSMSLALLQLLVIQVITVSSLDFSPNGGEEVGPPAQTPGVDLNEFLRRNEEFVAHADPEIFQATSTGQSPSVYWIGCSDSRVPLSLVAGAGIGEAFATHNIANQYDPKEASSVAALGYAVKTLKVPNVVVVGHEGCGGLAFALERATDLTEGKTLPKPNNEWDRGLISWVRSIQTAAYRMLLTNDGSIPHHDPDKSLDFAETDMTENEKLLHNLVEDNVKLQVQRIVESQVVQSTWNAGQNLSVHGWVYNILDGRIRVVTSQYHGPDHWSV